MEGSKMNTPIGDTLLALIESNEVKKNIEAEAQRKAKVQEQIARAMDRANREWR
jgi:hypothetical protein